MQTKYMQLKTTHKYSYKCSYQASNLFQVIVRCIYELHIMFYAFKHQQAEAVPLFSYNESVYYVSYIA